MPTATAPLSTAPTHSSDDHDDVTREIFFPVSNNYVGGALANRSFIGFYDTIDLDETGVGTLHMTGKVPDDFVSLSEVRFVAISAISGSPRLLYRSYYATEDEAYNSNNTSSSYDREAVVANEITELKDVNSLLSGIAKGDYFAINVRRDGASGPADSLHFIGLLFKYTAEQ